MTVAIAGDSTLAAITRRGYSFVRAAELRRAPPHCDNGWPEKSPRWNYIDVTRAER
ncbi:MAG: hypothetical protein R2706_07295 [Acidimicrobiales bacterium]